MNELANFDMPKYVIKSDGKQNNKVYIVDTVTLFEKDGDKNHSVHVNAGRFPYEYEEYISPEQMRIEALEEEIKQLRLQLAGGKKKRAHLPPDIRTQIKNDIKVGASKEEIIQEYNISESAYYRFRQEVYKEL